MKQRIKFIINPIAGQGKGRLAIPEVERHAKQLGFDYEIVTTEYPGHAIELARQSSLGKFDFIIAVGGDGTSNEVLNGILNAWAAGLNQSVFGILAIGRGNDLAYGYGIPPGLDAGFNVINRKQTKLVDVGKIIGGDYPQGRYFGNGVGIGFDTVVGFEAAKLTHVHGFMNYVIAALLTISLYFKAPKVKISYDNQTIILNSLMISIMNGRRMGGGFLMAPNAITDDGLLDLCIAEQVSRLGILFLIPKFMKGTQSNSKHIKTRTASKVNISALDGGLPIHADGETICVSGTEVNIEIIRKPIQILCG